MKLAIVPAVWDSHPTWLPHGRSPRHATRLWAVWQGLIPSFAHCFTRPGWRRFVTVPAARLLAGSSEAPSLRVAAPPGERLKWRDRTPAMAAGLTDRQWTMRELLSSPIPLPPWVAPKWPP